MFDSRIEDYDSMMDLGNSLIDIKPPKEGGINIKKALNLRKFRAL